VRSGPTEAVILDLAQLTSPLPAASVSDRWRLWKSYGGAPRQRVRGELVTTAGRCERAYERATDGP
jgi:hypothetical protein